MPAGFREKADSSAQNGLAMTRLSIGLLVFFRSSHGRLGGLEADFGVGSVAKRFIDRSAAAAEREGGFAGQVVWVAIGIDEFDRAFRSLYA